ncbi:MAG: hypothetical protein WBX22_24415 [Silvibacterium sp.]
MKLQDIGFILSNPPWIPIQITQARTALIAVVQLEGMGKLGQVQLHWLKQDLGGLKSSTPIVVFARGCAMSMAARQAAFPLSNTRVF